MTDDRNKNHNNLARGGGGEGFAYMKIWDKLKKAYRKIVIMRVRFLHGISQYFVSVSDFSFVNMNPLAYFQRKTLLLSYLETIFISHILHLTVSTCKAICWSFYLSESRFLFFFFFKIYCSSENRDM